MRTRRDRRAARPSGPSGLLGLPEDVLGAVLAFGDLRARFVGVAACTLLRDAHARMSPVHEHALLLRRFPILKTVLSSGSTLSPRELYLSQMRLFSGSDPYPIRRLWIWTNTRSRWSWR